MNTQTQYRLVLHDSDSDIYYLQFKSIAYQKKYFGLFGDVTAKEVWRFIPTVSKAQNELWLSETDFPVILVEKNSWLEQRFINSGVDNLKDFEKAYPNIQTYIEEIKRPIASNPLRASELVALKDMTFNYGHELVRMRSFIIQQQPVFLINFPKKDPVILVYDDKNPNQSPWWSFPDRSWKEKDEIVKLIGNNFSNNE